MGFDMGSSALQIFPYELTSLMRDLSFCHRAIVRYPTGSVEGRSFDLMIRILSPAGKECLPWLYERAGCVGHTFQDNCLMTMDAPGHHTNEVDGPTGSPWAGYSLVAISMLSVALQCVCISSQY